MGTSSVVLAEGTTVPISLSLLCFPSPDLWERAAEQCRGWRQAQVWEGGGGEKRQGEAKRLEVTREISAQEESKEHSTQARVLMGFRTKWNRSPNLRHFASSKLRGTQSQTDGGQGQP